MGGGKEEEKGEEEEEEEKEKGDGTRSKSGKMKKKGKSKSKSEVLGFLTLSPFRNSFCLFTTYVELTQISFTIFYFSCW